MAICLKWQPWKYKLSHANSFAIPTTSTSVCESAKCVFEAALCADVSVDERRSKRKHCKFLLDMTLRHVMMRSSQSANEEIPIHTFYE